MVRAKVGPQGPCERVRWGRTVCVGASHALFSKRVFHLVVQSNWVAFARAVWQHPGLCPLRRS